MGQVLLYVIPFSFDIVIGLQLFVARHSLASRGHSETIVGLVPLLFGVGYFLTGFLMRVIISRRYAKHQMLGAIALSITLSATLANVSHVPVVLGVFCLAPFTASLFFNAFQAYMLGVSDDADKPLAATVGHYTFAWSTGFALGPFISSAAKASFTWPQTYYIAAGLAAVVGLGLSLYRPTAAAAGRSEAPRRVGQTPLLGVSRIGLVLSYLGLICITTYWPVIAAQRGEPALVRGLVEFVVGFSQALIALSFAWWRGWFHKPGWLLAFGAAGALGVLLFGLGQSASQYIVAAAVYGVFCGAAYCFMVYQAMYEREKATRRVAVNEMFVGLSYVVSPVVAGLLRRVTPSFAAALLAMSAILAIGVLVQTLLGVRAVRAARRAGTFA
jgi:MFS family permease